MIQFLLIMCCPTEVAHSMKESEGVRFTLK